MASATDLPKLYQGVQKQSFGYKMLSTMGWKEGQGLGANHQGIKEHIKVKKKQDAFGVGAAEQAHQLRDWTTGMVGYDAILSGLKEITRSAAPSSSSDSGSDSGNTSSSSGGHSSGYDSDSDTSNDAAARAAARKAKKGGKKQPGKAKGSTGGTNDSSKKKRKQIQTKDAPAPAAKRQKRSSKAAAGADSDSSASSGSESDSSSNSDGEPAAAAAPAALSGVSRVKAATHLGRYAKRERAKTVRNYSASDLAAILGLPSSAPVVEGGEGADAWAAAAAAAGAAAGGGNAGRDGGGSSSEDTSSSSSSSGSDSDSDSRGGSEQRLRPGTPPGSDSPATRVEQGSDDVDAKPSGRPLDAGRSTDASADAADAKAWWRSVFVKSGGSGSSLGMRPASKAINAHGFLEDDQTNLYMQAHATATTGKQGLGRSSMPKKVAGARWQGKKTKLGSDDEDDEQQQEQQEQDAAADSIAAAAAAAGREQYVKNGILVILPVKKKQVQDPAAAAQQPQEQQAKTKSKKKSKKAAAAGSGQEEQQQADNSKQPAAGKKRKQQEEAAAAAAAETSSKRSKKQAGKQAADASAGPAADSAQRSNVKWAKLAARILEEAPKRRMRIQKLHKKVVAAAGYDVDAPGVDTEVLYRQMLKKLRKAEGLQVCEKYVGLSA